MNAQVVIVGGGFAGLNAARQLKDAPVDITLIDRRNHHLFQPLLYQVATGELSPRRTSPRRCAACSSTSATRACCWPRSPASTCPTAG